MPLEFEKIEDIPEPIRDEFTQIDGKGAWVPKGYIPEAVHSEMKGRMGKQAARLKDLDDLAARWGEDDPDALRTSAAEAGKAAKKLEKLQADLDAAVKAKADLEAKGTGEDPKKVDQLVTEAQEALRAELAEQHQAEIESHSTKYGELEKVNGDLVTRLNVLEIDNAIDSAAATVKGFRKAALRDARNLARQVFRRGSDGRVLPYDENGKVIFVDDKETLSPQKWLESQREVEESRHWFEAPASGGGGGGDNPKPGGNGAKTRPAEDRANMSPAEQVKFANEGGEFV